MRALRKKRSMWDVRDGLLPRGRICNNEYVDEDGVGTKRTHAVRRNLLAHGWLYEMIHTVREAYVVCISCM